METTELGIKLATPALSKNQISITEIPRELYSHFYSKKIGDVIKTETWGETRLWFELPVSDDDKTDKVIAIFTERSTGISVETRFALMPWYPGSGKDDFGGSYDFEIFAKPQSKGWTLGEGNRSIEVLSYQTKNSIRNPLVANHPMVDYIAMAIVEMRRLLKEKASMIVRQEFIDNAPKPLN